MQIIYTVKLWVSIFFMRKLYWEKNVGKLEDVLNAPDYSDEGLFVECDLKYPDNIKDKSIKFAFCPPNKVSPQYKFSDHMNEMKVNNYTKNWNLICDCLM